MRQWLFATVAILGLGIAHAATPGTAVLHAADMTCPACNVTIRKALSRVMGITGTQIDLKAETVTMTFDADRTTTSALVRAVTDAGFPAKVQTHGG